MQDDLAIGKHISSNPQFLAITYDRNRDLYYRLTVAPYDGEVSNNRAGTRGRLFISVYDRNFELTHEEKKKDYRFIPNLMTSNGLMLIPNPNLTEEDAFKSLIFTAKCPN